MLLLVNCNIECVYFFILSDKIFLYVRAWFCCTNSHVWCRHVCNTLHCMYLYKHVQRKWKHIVLFILNVTLWKKKLYHSKQCRHALIQPTHLHLCWVNGNIEDGFGTHFYTVVFIFLVWFCGVDVWMNCTKILNTQIS